MVVRHYAVHAVGSIPDVLQEGVLSSVSVCPHVDFFRIILVRT